MSQPCETFRAKNGKEIKIRGIEPGDAEAMIRFMHTVDGETRFLTREPGEFALSSEEERNFIRKQTEDARSYWNIAEDSGRIIANCGIFGVGNKKRLLHRAVAGIVVLKEFWGVGLGRKLLGDGIARCREMGYEKLELSVLADNARAIALYKSLGFEIEGTCRHAFKYPDGTYADDYWMGMML